MPDPHLRPARKVPARDLLEGAYKIAPLRVRLGVVFEVKAQAIAKVLLAEHEGKQLKNRGRLGVDDGAVPSNERATPKSLNETLNPWRRHPYPEGASASRLKAHRH